MLTQGKPRAGYFLRLTFSCQLCRVPRYRNAPRTVLCHARHRFSVSPLFPYSCRRLTPPFQQRSLGDRCQLHHRLPSPRLLRPYVVVHLSKSLPALRGYLRKWPSGWRSRCGRCPDGRIFGHQPVLWCRHTGIGRSTVNSSHRLAGSWLAEQRCIGASTILANVGQQGHLVRARDGLSADTVRASLRLCRARYVDRSLVS